MVLECESKFEMKDPHDLLRTLSRSCWSFVDLFMYINRSSSRDLRFMFVVYGSDLIVKTWFAFIELALEVSDSVHV
jgi:hypothetical protein